MKVRNSCSQENPEICQVHQTADGTWFEGKNLINGQHVKSEVTTLPIISCIGMHQKSQILYIDEKPTNDRTKGLTINDLKSQTPTAWHAPSNFPSGSMVNLIHTTSKSPLLKLKSQDFNEISLNRFTDVCKADFKKFFQQHGINVPEAFFDELGHALKTIKTDTISERLFFDKTLNRLLDQYLPKEKDQFLQVCAKYNFEQREKIEEFIDKIFTQKNKPNQLTF